MLSNSELINGISAVYSVCSASSAEETYSEIYSNMVVPCVSFIEQREYDAAYNLYKTTVDMLKSRFLLLDSSQS